MSEYGVTIDQSQIDSVFKALEGIKNGAPRAITRALNSTAKTTRTQAVKLATAKYRLSSAFLKTRIWGPNERPGNKATFNRQVAKVTAQQRGLRLYHFVTDEGSRVSGGLGGGGKEIKPIKVQVFRKGGAKSLTPNRLGGTAFIAKLKNSGEKGVFVRLSPTKVQHLYGPSPSQIFQGQLPELSKAMSDVLIERIDKEVKGVLAQYG